MLHHYIHHIMCCVLPVLHRYEQQCERVGRSVGTVELAFLSVSLCQLLFRSSTQETCAPAEKAWQTQHNSLQTGGTLKQERTRERHSDRYMQSEMTKRGMQGIVLEGVKQWQQLLLIKNQKIGGGFIADRARERKLRGPGMKRKCMWTKEERATEQKRRGGREGSRQGREV